MSNNLMPMVTRDACPLCAHPRYRIFYEWGYGNPCNRIRVINSICENCGVIFLNPYPDKQRMRAYYEDYLNTTQAVAAAAPPVFLMDHLLAIARLRLKFLRPHLRHGDRVFDIGCGFGVLLKVLRDETELNLQLQGINPEPGAVLFAQQELALNVQTGMLEDVHLPPKSYDVIILDNVLEHLIDQSAALKKLHELLADDGRLFVSTNNVDQLHGFAWQNFFADHTVTYSKRTLAAHLASEGFAVIAHDISGHVTYEGYHYPYQNCVAVKTNRPVAFDFSKCGDDFEFQINALKQYIHNYRHINPWSKILYEVQHGPPEYQTERRVRVLKHLMNRYANSTHLPHNHTLPPEHLFRRKVVLAHCATESDSQLGIQLIEKSGLNPEYLFIRRHEGQFRLDKATPDIRKRALNIPERFTSVIDAWNWLECLFPQISERIEIKLNNADLPETALERVVRQVRKTGISLAMADYSFFTDAFIRYSCDNAHNTPAQLVGPDAEDATYYFRNKGATLFRTPRSVSLDLAPQCTNFCDKCQFHSPRSPYRHLVKKNDYMDVELAKSLLDQCAQMVPVPSFAPTFSGEPLLYPHFEEILRYAKSLNIPISITTNGVLLNEDVSQMLLDVGISALVISIDAYSDQLYSQLQAPRSLEKVRSQVLRFLELRGETRQPQVGLIFVLEKRNIDEWNNYFEFWRNHVDFITRSLHQDQFSALQATMPYFAKRGKRMACFCAWTSMYIRWNGQVSFCGFDIAANKINLDVHEHSLLDIWNSTSYQQWREAQIRNNYKILYCKGCPDWSVVRRLMHQDEAGNWNITPISETWTKS